LHARERHKLDQPSSAGARGRAPALYVLVELPIDLNVAAVDLINHRLQLELATGRSRSIRGSILSLETRSGLWAGRTRPSFITLQQ
jgi:hypothetical protein